jgi:sterol desaturase/sphingolipid hydroxylase (fatty acid hydroxylase superfamily)
MTQENLRLGFFLAGLIGFAAWEFLARHHDPVVPRGRRWIRNLALGAVNGVVTSFVCASCFLLAANDAAPWRYGPLQLLAFPIWIRIPLEVVVLDLLVYGLHRTYHAQPLLWRLHRVHHTDRDLDVSSASRFHLGEVLVSASAKFSVVQLLGISPVGLVVFEIVMLLAAQFQHANVRVPAAAERALWRVFVPPAMHRIHHHPLRAATDSNYGTLLSAWDRVFATLRRDAPSDREFGVPELPEAQSLGLIALILLPIRKPG